jgi:murein L,D-transpeptidase YafK
MRVTFPLEDGKKYSRRSLLASYAASASVASFGLPGSLYGQSSFAQSASARGPRIRIQTSPTGQTAIERVAGRLQFAFEDLGLVYGAPIYLRLIKEQQRLEVWVQNARQVYVRLRSYKVCGSSGELGPKRTPRAPPRPEGFYVIGSAGLRPNGVAYLGVDIGWPNAFDRAQGWNGSKTFLQAGCAGQPHFGLTDQDMEEVYALIYKALSRGQTSVPFHIFPFAMNGLRMMSINNSPHATFWRGLEPAWRAFERTKKPPQVSVLGRRYLITEG